MPGKRATTAGCRKEKINTHNRKIRCGAVRRDNGKGGNRCTVVPRLSAKDLQAIRDLQGIKNNLNNAVKFINYFMKMNGKADGQQLIESVGITMKCVRFITDMIEKYRNGGG